MVVRAARTMPMVSSQRRYLILFNLSLYAQDEGLLRAAELFQDAAVVEADRRGNPLTIVESRLRRAQLSLRRGRVARAARDLEWAGARMDAVQSSSSAAYLRSWRERLGAALEMPRAARTASARLEALAREFQRIEPAEVPGVYLEAGRAALDAGDAPLAERQLRLGADFVLARGARLENIEYRAGYLSAAWDIFHDLIGLRFTRDRADALSIAETARRALGRREPGVSLPATGIASLPGDTALLYYSVLKDRVLLWTLGMGGLTSQAILYAEEDLAADVDAYRQSLLTAHRDRGRGEVARRLYDRLVAPALSRTGPEIHVLLIAPDGPLGDLPFGALFMPSGERLVERYETALVAQLPGASVPRDTGAPASVLAVGFNGGDSQLPALAAAEREADLVSRFYTRPALLVGDGATGDAVRRASPGHDVIHVAAHARANRLMPWESRLMLAPDGAAGGAVRFEAIRAWNLRDCRLVVLSACETSTASRAHGQGLLSLASPFLDAGARVVIGTLWPVDDRASVAFMELLHRHVAAGRPPADALRAAQLTALRSDDPNLSAPFTWAAYVATTK
jgi:CHAT domain-containing protein